MGCGDHLHGSLIFAGIGLGRSFVGAGENSGCAIGFGIDATLEPSSSDANVFAAVIANVASCLF